MGIGAELLSLCIVLSGLDAFAEDLLTDEGWHCLSVVHETWSGAVLAGTVEYQGILYEKVESAWKVARGKCFHGVMMGKRR